MARCPQEQADEQEEGKKHRAHLLSEFLTPYFTQDFGELHRRGIVSGTPVGRGGQPNDIAAALLSLVSPDASFVTGEVLNVNGGWLFGR